MRKMVQPRRWLVQLILLCQLWQLGAPCFGGTEHRSVGVHQEGQEEGDLSAVVLFVIIVLVSEYGKKLAKGYRCPLYCEVKHTHIYDKKKSDIQGNDELSRPDKSKDREQSESSIRPITGI